jgi:tRNA-specific 2-thiouridylase
MNRHDHFKKPLNRGAIGGADGVGHAGEAGCGAAITIYVAFAGDKVSRCGFEAEGASTAIAAGSAMCEAVAGMTWRDAAAVSTKAVCETISGGGKAGAVKCPPATAAEFAVDALHGAFEDAIRRKRFPRAERRIPAATLIAMSGGVDSSVACVLSERTSSMTLGLTMRLWSDPGFDSDDASCCSPAAVRDAREVCHQLGLPHLTIDLADAFEDAVVSYFVGEYGNGRTPNPCTYCNAGFRFPLLMELADMLGAERVATGHYARIARRKVAGQEMPLIVRGIDASKDQSYMLWGISQGMLDRIDFPLGEMSKGDTRRIARQQRLSVHQRPESQEVCFIPDDDYRRFIRARMKDPPGEGVIVDSSGEKIGRHDGYIDYTIGQRRGMGVSANEPLYVLRTDPEHNLVVAGTREELAVTGLEIAEINHFLPLSEIETADVQVRYNSKPVAACVEWSSGPAVGSKAKGKISLEQATYGIATGQSAVLYQDEAVVAGGIIVATSV